MDTAPRSVAVVATRLPNLDRRVLSQAWYSALHLADESPRAPAQAKAAAAPPSPHAAGSHGRVAARPSPPAAAGADDRVAIPARTACVDRRGPAGDLARRIERAVVRRSPAAAHPASIAISVGDGRVQLLVRCDAGTTRIVALCAPHLRERVDRALAQARFALAAGGTRIEAA